MNHLSKSILIVVVLLLLAGCTRNKTGTDTAQIVGKTAVLIADFSPPDGYKPEFGLHALGYTIVAYNKGEAQGHLYLVQSENEADSATLAQALADLTPGYHEADSQMTVVEQRPLTIRNQSVTLTVSEGAKWGDEPVRQATAVFQGKGGPTLLTLLEPVAAWDDTAVEAFLSAIR